MKAINRFILEKLKITNNSCGYTLRNFIEWYINEGPDCELTVHNVRYLDFNRSPSTTWRMFDGSSTNIAKFLLNHLDDCIDLTEDINKEEKSITYTFYIDDIFFVVLAVYNTRTKYPAFFDKYVNESLVSEKLKVSKDVVSDIDDESNDLQDLAKQWTIWTKRQKSRFPEIMLRAMYKKHNIKRPSIMHPYNNTSYDLVSFMGYERSDGGCNVTLFYFYNGNKYLVMKRETKSYDKLIELLGDGNIKDGEVIYNEIVNKLNN